MSTNHSFGNVAPTIGNVAVEQLTGTPIVGSREARSTKTATADGIIVRNARLDRSVLLTFTILSTSPSVPLLEAQVASQDVADVTPGLNGGEIVSYLNNDTQRSIAGIGYYQDLADFEENEDASEMTYSIFIPNPTVSGGTAT